MSEQGHDLHALFPEDHAILVALKARSPHFRRLAERYHVVSEQVFEADAGLDAAPAARVEKLKKERLTVLDEVANMIAADKPAHR